MIDGNSADLDRYEREQEELEIRAEKAQSEARKLAAEIVEERYETFLGDVDNNCGKFFDEIKDYLIDKTMVEALSPVLNGE